MRQLSRPHSYEELRGVVIDILLGREKTASPQEQYSHLLLGVGEVLVRRGSEAPNVPLTGSPAEIRLQPQDVELVRDVFWDLFRQGFITLGRGDNNPPWPWFRLSHNAKATLEMQSPYRFHDTSSYLALVKAEAIDVSANALLYLDEAVAAFYADCLLASCVMLGVAAEAEFLRLIDVAVANASVGPSFARANSERQIRQKIARFQEGLTSLPKSLRDQAGEDMDTNLHTIQSVLRIARNEAGHPSGSKPPSREQVYVYLQLFVPLIGQFRRLRLALT
jgi:hypothetical protein